MIAPEQLAEARNTAYIIYSYGRLNIIG